MLQATALLEGKEPTYLMATILTWNYQPTNTEQMVLALSRPRREGGGQGGTSKLARLKLSSFSRVGQGSYNQTVAAIRPLIGLWNASKIQEKRSVGWWEWSRGICGCQVAPGLSLVATEQRQGTNWLHTAMGILQLHLTRLGWSLLLQASNRCIIFFPALVCFCPGSYNPWEPVDINWLKYFYCISPMWVKWDLPAQAALCLRIEQKPNTTPLGCVSV